MGRKKDITEFVRGQIYAYSDSGISQRETARKLSISRWAVKNVLIKAPDTQSARCSRVKKTTLRNDRLLKAMVTRSPDASSSRIAETVRMSVVNICSRTVRR